MVTTVTKNLYQRLGGYDALEAFSEDLLKRLKADPQIGVYWRGQSTDSFKKGIQLLTDFLCSAFGGKCIYMGRDMITSHTGLHISEADWQVFLKHAVATLDKFNIQGQERQEVVAAVAGLKPMIVGI